MIRNMQPPFFDRCVKLHRLLLNKYGAGMKQNSNMLPAVIDVARQVEADVWPTVSAKLQHKIDHLAMCAPVDCESRSLAAASLEKQVAWEIKRRVCTRLDAKLDAEIDARFSAKEAAVKASFEVQIKTKFWNACMAGLQPFAISHEPSLDAFFKFGVGVIDARELEHTLTAHPLFIYATPAAKERRPVKTLRATEIAIARMGTIDKNGQSEKQDAGNKGSEKDKDGDSDEDDQAYGLSGKRAVNSAIIRLQRKLEQHHIDADALAKRVKQKVERKLLTKLDADLLLKTEALLRPRDQVQIKIDM